MRRDAGSELVAALIAVGILALALVFGLVLTLTQRADAALTQSPPTQAAQVKGAVPTVTASNIPPTGLPTTTTAPMQSPTASPSPTAEPAPPSPSATETRTSTAAATAAPPTLTPSPTASVTPSRTVTRTFTATAAATATRTATATHTFTASPRPTLTRTPTHTHTPTATSTPSPTFTPSHTPTPTLFVPTFPPELLTPTPLSAAASTDAPCTPRRDWIAYTVQAGETLFSLARRAQISSAELARANCLADPSRLVVGAVIYVPRPPAAPTPRALPGVNIRNCDDPQRRMVNVPPDGRLSGVFTILGTAQHEAFQFYKVEIRAEGGEVWQNLITRSTPTSGALAELNTALFPGGIYWLRLTVVDQAGNFPPPCEVRVTLNP